MMRGGVRQQYYGTLPSEIGTLKRLERTIVDWGCKLNKTEPPPTPPLAPPSPATEKENHKKIMGEEEEEEEEAAMMMMMATGRDRTLKQCMGYMQRLIWRSCAASLKADEIEAVHREFRLEVAHILSCVKCEDTWDVLKTNSLQRAIEILEDLLITRMLSDFESSIWKFVDSSSSLSGGEGEEEEKKEREREGEGDDDEELEEDEFGLPLYATRRERERARVTTRSQ